MTRQQRAEFIAGTGIIVFIVACIAYVVCCAGCIYLPKPDISPAYDTAPPKPLPVATQPIATASGQVATQAMIKDNGAATTAALEKAVKGSNDALWGSIGTLIAASAGVVVSVINHKRTRAALDAAK